MGLFLALPSYHAALSIPVTTCLTVKTEEHFRELSPTDQFTP